MDMDIVPCMGFDGDPMACRGGGDASPFGYAAANRCIGLEQRGCARGDEVLETPAPRFDFSGCHGDGCGSGKACMVVDVVGRKRLLEPERVIGLETARILKCGG